jgi:hypothetical protein
MLRAIRVLCISVLLVLLAAFAFVWARSYKTRDVFAWSTSAGDIRGIHCSLGRILVYQNSPSPGSLMTPYPQLLGFHSGPATPIAATPIYTHGSNRQSPREYSGPLKAGLLRPAPPPPRKSFCGVGYRDTTWIGLRSRELVMPLSLLTALAALAPMIFASRVIAQAYRRRNLSLCRHCNYDLRASTDRCPECGHPIPATATTAAIPQAAKPATATPPPANPST